MQNVYDRFEEDVDALEGEDVDAIDIDTADVDELEEDVDALEEDIDAADVDALEEDVDVDAIDEDAIDDAFAEAMAAEDEDEFFRILRAGLGRVMRRAAPGLRRI